MFKKQHSKCYLLFVLCNLLFAICYLTLNPSVLLFLLENFWDNDFEDGIRWSVHSEKWSIFPLNQNNYIIELIYVFFLKSCGSKEKSIKN